MNSNQSDELRLSVLTRQENSLPSSLQLPKSKQSARAYQIENLLVALKSQCNQCKCQCHSKQANSQNRQIQSIKLKYHLQQSQYNFNVQMLQNQLDQIKYENECLLQENKTLKEFLVTKQEQLRKISGMTEKYQKKIKNQEILIDEYKISLEEQITLEKEVIKAAYYEKQCQLRNQFEKALRNMETNYKKQVKDCQKKQLSLQYTQDLKKIKKFCSKLMETQGMGNSIGEEKQNRQLKGVGSTKKLYGCSSYSTLDK